MYAIASSFGVTLVFSSREELEGVIKHLSGMTAHISDAPYLYHISDSSINKDELNQHLEWLKKALATELE